MQSASQNKADNYYNQAVHSMRSKRIGDAEQKLKKALKANPRHLKSYILLGDLAMESGRATVALKNYNLALKLNPHNARVWRNMGSVQLVMLHDYNTAIASLSQAIQLDPTDAETYHYLGQASYNMRNYADAAALLEAGLQIQPIHSHMMATLGMCYITLRDFTNAQEYLFRAFQINPQDHSVFTKVLQSTRTLNYTKEQLAEINEVAEALKDHAKFKDRIALHDAYMLRKEGNYKAMEEKLTAFETGDPEVFVTKNYLLGDAYRHQGRPDDAFKAYSNANKVHLKSNAGQTYSLKSVYELFQESYDHITQENAPRFLETIKQTPDPEYKTPYFVIGFPRSGTTLTGQILNQHPALITLDEHSAMDQIKLHVTQQFGLALPRDFDKMTQEHLKFMHQLFNERQIHAPVTNPDKHIIDKMPFNTAHIASILQLFPKTKIIYLQRHPLDCVLSCFMQNFGLNAANIHFLDIKNAAKLYKEHHALWTHYKETLPFDFQEIRYENIVSDFDGEIGKAIKLLDLEWDDRLHEFYKEQTNENGPTTLTPSRHQVSKKLYGSAKYRWKDYRDHLEAAIEILEPTIIELGYDLD